MPDDWDSLAPAVSSSGDGMAVADDWDSLAPAASPPQPQRQVYRKQAAPTGLRTPGNIDLRNRPVVKNADGSISTVRSMSVGTDDGEVLLPTISDDGRVLEPDQAMQQYQQTGKHLGVFDTPENATAYAQQLHRDQDQLYRNGAPMPSATEWAQGLKRDFAGTPAQDTRLRQIAIEKQVTSEDVARERENVLANMPPDQQEDARRQPFFTDDDYARKQVVQMRMYPNGVMQEPPRQVGPSGLAGASRAFQQNIAPLARAPLFGPAGEQYAQSMEEATPAEGVGGTVGNIVGMAARVGGTILAPELAIPTMAAESARSTYDQTQDPVAAVGSGMLSMVTQRLGLEGANVFGQGLARKLGDAILSKDQAVTKALLQYATGGAAQALTAGELQAAGDQAILSARGHQDISQGIDNYLRDLPQRSLIEAAGGALGGLAHGVGASEMQMRRGPAADPQGRQGVRVVPNTAGGEGGAAGELGPAATPPSAPESPGGPTAGGAGMDVGPQPTLGRAAQQRPAVLEQEAAGAQRAADGEDRGSQPKVVTNWDDLSPVGTGDDASPAAVARKVPFVPSDAGGDKSGASAASVGLDQRAVPLKEAVSLPARAADVAGSSGSDAIVPGEIKGGVVTSAPRRGFWAGTGSHVAQPTAEGVKRQGEYDAIDAPRKPISEFKEGTSAPVGQSTVRVAEHSGGTGGVSGFEVQPLSDDLKVFDPVIRSIPVAVVNMLGGKEGATNVLLHNPTVLVTSLAAHLGANIASGAAPLRAAVARLRAKLGLARLGGRRTKHLAAADALHRHLSEALARARSPETASPVLPSEESSVASSGTEAPAASSDLARRTSKSLGAELAGAPDTHDEILPQTRAGNTLHELTFSDRSGKQTTIKLGGTSSPPAESSPARAPQHDTPSSPMPGRGSSIARQEAPAAGAHRPFMERMLRRMAREETVKNVAEDMAEEGTSVPETIDRFFGDTLPQMPEAQRIKFIDRIERTTGNRPGDVAFTKADGSEVKYASHHELMRGIADYEGGNDITKLEKPIQGLIALMKIGNDGLAEERQHTKEVTGEVQKQEAAKLSASDQARKGPGGKRPAAVSTTGAKGPGRVQAVHEEEAAGVLKQPWEMTKKDWQAQANPVRIQERLSPEQRANQAASHRQGFRLRQATHEKPYYTVEGVNVAFPRAKDAVERGHRIAVELAIASGKTVPANVLAEYPDLAPPSSLAKQPWQMAMDNYAEIRGAPKPVIDLHSDISAHQRSKMSSRAIQDISKAKSKDRREASAKYRSAVEEWEKAVWNGYQAGEFSLNSVHDTDSFYVVRDRVESTGIEIDSPFKISKRSDADRLAYLDQIDLLAREHGVVSPAKSPISEPTSPSKSLTGPSKEPSREPQATIPEVTHPAPAGGEAEPDHARAAQAAKPEVRMKVAVRGVNETKAAEPRDIADLDTSDWNTARAIIEALNQKPHGGSSYWDANLDPESIQAVNAAIRTLDASNRENMRELSRAEIIKAVGGDAFNKAFPKSAGGDLRLFIAKDADAAQTKALAGAVVEMGKARTSKAGGAVPKGTPVTPNPVGLHDPKPAKSTEDRIKSITAARATDTSRYAVNGVLVAKSGSEMAVTDGRRLFVLEGKKGQFGKDGLYDGRAAHKGKLTPHDDPEAKFPPYEAIYPQVDQDSVLEIRDVPGEIQKLREVSLMTNSDQRGVAVYRNRDGTLGYAAELPDVGQVESGLNDGATYLGNVNPVFIAEALRFIHTNAGLDRRLGNIATFSWRSSDKPIMIEARGPEGIRARTVTMPVTGADLREKPSEAPIAKIGRGNKSSRPAFGLNPIDLARSAGSTMAVAGRSIASLVSGSKPHPTVEAAFKSLQGHVLPKLSARDENATNATVRFAVAHVAGPRIAADFSARVLGKEYKNEPFRRLLGAVLVEDRLRGIRKAAQDRSAAATDPDAKKAADDEAKKVTSIVGAPNSPLATEQQYQDALKDQNIKSAVAAHQAILEPYMQATFRYLQEDPAAQFPTPGPDTGAFVNLKALDPNEPDESGVAPSGKRGNLQKFYKQRSAFAVHATGSADWYEIDYQKIVENTVTRDLERAAKNKMYDALKAAALAIEAKPGAKFKMADGSESSVPEIEGKPARRIEIVRKGRPAGDGKATTHIKNLWVAASVYPEVYTAGDPTESLRSTLPAAIANSTTALQVIGLTDFVSHATNILRGVAGNLNVTHGPVALRLGRFLQMGKPLEALVRIGHAAYQVGRDTPAVRKQLAELASIGALRPAAYKGWTLKFLKALDSAGRVAMDSVYKEAVKAGFKDSEALRREFSNQLGQYEPRLHAAFLRAMREMGIAPFAVAGTTFNRQAVRALMGGSTLKAGGRVGGATAWLGRIVGTMVASLVMAGIANWMLGGSMNGRPGVPFGAIDTRKDDAKGKPIYVDPLSWSGARRGLKLIGAQAIAEGLRYGRGKGDITDDAMTDILMGGIHPWAGPIVTTGAIALTGKDLRGVQVAPVARPDQSQRLSNLKAAAEHANPMVESFIEGEQRGGVGQGLIDSIVKPFERAAGIGSGTPPNDLARHFAELKDYIDDLDHRARKLPRGERRAFIAAETSGMPMRDKGRVLDELYERRQVLSRP